MTRKEMKTLAKQKLKGNWGIALGSVLIAGVITGVASSAFGIVELIVAGPVAFGLCCVFLNIFRKGKADIEDLFEGFTKNFFNNFITGLLVSVFTFLWSLLFIIPGIIKTYAYAMTFYIQNDHPEMTETDAITASREMMRGHKWELFVLDLSFIGWYLLCGLTFGLLALYVVPYHNAARTAFYENLAGTSCAKGGADEAAKEEPEDAETAAEVAAIEAAPAAAYSDDDDSAIAEDNAIAEALDNEKSAIEEDPFGGDK